MFHRITVLIATIALSICGAYAGGKADDKAAISFHMETEATDNPKMIFPQEMANGTTKYFRRVPEVSIKDVVAMGPFPADDGSYGLVLQLKESAAKRYLAVTNANIGKFLGAQVNGRVVDGVLIDKGIADGTVVIWRGVTLQDIEVFDEVIPRIGQKKPKGKQKKK